MAEARLRSLFDKVFNEIADIDAEEFQENVSLSCLLPEELRTLKESRIRNITENFSKFLIALMKTKELRKACLNAIDNEKELLELFRKGLKAVENDYLGGNGSRVYGQISFGELHIEELSENNAWGINKQQ